MTTSMKVLDGNGTDYYLETEGAGTSGDPARIKRVLTGGYKVLTCEFTRPANSTAYAAKDCLADNAPSITTQILAGAGRIVGGSGGIIRAVMKTNLSTWTNPISVVIYNAAPGGGFIADNVAFDRMYVDAAKAMGQIDFYSFGTLTGGTGAMAWSVNDALNIPYECGAAVQDLYFQCYIPSGTPTPASGQKFYLVVGVLRD